MAKRASTFKGFDEAQLKLMSLEDFMNIIPSRARRSLKNGLTEQQKKLIARVKKVKEGKIKKPIKTHCRDMIIIPNFIGHTIGVYTGREYVNILITYEMLGKFLGEFALSRKKVAHSAPGIGATKSSSSMSVK